MTPMSTAVCCRAFPACATALASLLAAAGPALRASTFAHAYHCDAPRATSSPSRRRRFSSEQEENITIGPKRRSACPPAPEGLDRTHQPLSKVSVSSREPSCEQQASRRISLVLPAPVSEAAIPKEVRSFYRAVRQTLAFLEPGLAVN